VESGGQGPEIEGLPGKRFLLEESDESTPDPTEIGIRVARRGRGIPSTAQEGDADDPCDPPIHLRFPPSALLVMNSHSS